MHDGRCRLLVLFVVCLSLYVECQPFMCRYILAGTFTENFDLSLGVGDLMLDEEDEKSQDPGGKKKVQPGTLPEIDGEETVAEYVAKFKRACLAKKNIYRDVMDKLVEDKVTGHESPVCKCILSRCALPLPTAVLCSCMLYILHIDIQACMFINYL